ncbi:hypothetical protein ACS0TY_020330 [Phlomoides rotata]
MEKMAKIRVVGLVLGLMIIMSSCMPAAARKLTAAEEKQKVVGEDSGLHGENHHAYSIPDFNRQGGGGAPGRD